MSATSFPSQTPLDAAPRKSRVGRIILFVVLGIVALLLVLGGVAYAVAGRFFTAQHNTLALLPSDTQLYASINPNLSAIPGLTRLQKAYQQSDPEASADAEQQLEDTLGLNFRTDVQPWIGAEMAIAVSGIQQFDADADAEELARTADVSILLASRDDAKAEEALAKIRAKRQADHGESFTDETYKSVKITSSSGGEDASPLGAYAIVEHNAVIASRADTIKQMIDRVGATENTLAQSDAYKQTIAGLPADAVAYAYISGDLIRDAVELSYDQTLEQVGDNAALREQIERQRQVMNAFVGGGASISAPAEGVQFDASIKFDMAQLNQLDQEMRDTINAAKTPISDALLRSISKDAILTYAGPIPDTFRTQIERVITSSPEAEQQVAALEQQFDLDLEQDVLGWLSGEFALVALPAGEQSDESMLADVPVSGYLVVRSKDMAAAKAGLPKIATALEQVGGVAFESKQIGGAEWQTISDPGTEQALGGYGFVGDAVVLGFLEPGLAGAAGASSAALPDDATFKAAQGRVASPSGGLLYLDVPAAVDVALNVRDQSRADFEQSEAGKALKPIESVIAGGEPGINDEGLFKSRLFVTINEQ
jgi:hypothetical protein